MICTQKTWTKIFSTVPRASGLSKFQLVYTQNYVSSVVSGLIDAVVDALMWQITRTSIVLSYTLKTFYYIPMFIISLFFPNMNCARQTINLYYANNHLHSYKSHLKYLNLCSRHLIDLLN